ncbi:DUF5336 domain-containing protein [Gordonia hydrophobica]|uniref:DUF5336 domain-containing protein n=1 Tax=Gordonia hydrophobica TaxID=40516 RepID=A0ABZ2U3E5_9ACTN|nr:DUF5336 domain-containing protein [Gordonia hydrophobica]MBM7367429.1 hypothetical protein [Gordonia hydrophobica]
MTYPQSGPGYGQGDAGQSAYGQQQHAQQAGYGQQQYGQQAGYGQQQYGQQAGYGQQQYGYQAPKPPSQGLPATTPTILAAVIGALGVITLFLGFLSAGTFSGSGTSKDIEIGKLYETAYALPWGLLAVAGLLAATTFLVGHSKGVVAALTALTGVGALATVFVISTGSGKGGLGAYDSSEIKSSAGVGAIILLIFAILSFIAAIFWLLIESGQVKVAGATAADASAAQAVAPAVDTSAYGYGQQAQQSASYGQQAPTTYQAGQSYGQPAASGYAQPTSSPSNPLPSNPLPSTPLPSTPADPGATTAFQKPEGQQDAH